MFSKNKSEARQKSDHPVVEESKAKRDVPSDDLPKNSINTGTQTLFHLFITFK